MVEYCPFCYDEENDMQFECVMCRFCTKFYHNGDRILKKRKNVNPLEVASSSS